MSNKRFIKIANYQHLAIFDMSQPTLPLFNPANPQDIEKCRHLAMIKEYIPELNKKYPKLMLFKSNHYNFGVITAEPIKKNRIICEYQGEIGSLDNTTRPSTVKKYLLKNKKIHSRSSIKSIYKKINERIDRISHYAFEIKRNLDVMAHEKRSIAGFINHNATDANVISDVINDTIYYKAARDISTGEQLLVDYGPDYDYQNGLRYIPCMENHLSTAAFLQQHRAEYCLTPFKMTKQEQACLQTGNSYLLIPNFLQHLLNNAEAIVEHPSISRYPVIELEKYRETNGKHYLYLSNEQKNLTALMIACFIKNDNAIHHLIKKYKVDVFAKTTDDLDAFIIAIKSSTDEKLFLSHTKILIRTMTAKLNRPESIGSDYDGKTALHLLVKREWDKAIALCDNPTFFTLVDGDGYDALLFAIAHGKAKALTALLKLKCVKKNLHELLLAEDEKKKDSIFKRAINKTPRKSRAIIHQLIMQACARKPKIKKIIQKFLNNS